MPPPIEDVEEEEEEVVHGSRDPAEGASSSDETVLNNARGAVAPSRSIQSSVSPEPVTSDIPLVTSDVRPPNETGAPEPEAQESGRRERRLKRKLSPKRSNHGAMAKRRKGNLRALPCVLCARRLANDPKWACHDAIVSQDGISGYSGTRCDECISSHVSCFPIPANAVEPVKALVQAAEEVNNHDGNQNIAVLAAYEATVGPVLSALVGIKVKNNPVTKGSRIPKRKKKRDNYGRNSGKGKVALPQATGHSRQSRDLNPQLVSENRNSGFQRANPDPAVLPAPLQTERGQKQPENNTDAFEKLERQALRRRKVEALESLAHTAALFLAEFMSFSKGRQEPATTGSPAVGPGQHQTGSGVGAAYAAAAAGMAANIFQPLSEEVEHSAYNSSESGMEHSSSSPDTSDDEDSPYRIPSESRGDMDMDESGDDETRSGMVASFGSEEQADDDEPEVKVEEH